MNNRNMALANRLWQLAQDDDACGPHGDALADAAISLADWQPTGTPRVAILWRGGSNGLVLTDEVAA